MNGARNVNSSYLASPLHPCRDPPSPLLSTGKLVSWINNDWRRETRGLLCVWPHFVFLSLSLSEENALGTPAGGCLPHTSIISPEQATDYWLSAVTQSSARQLLHFKLETKQPILVFTHWLVTHGRGRKWKCQRKRRAGGSLITAESSWAAGEQGQQLQGLRKESLQEVTECVDGSVQLITDSSEWLIWSWGQMWKQLKTHRG